MKTIGVWFLGLGLLLALAGGCQPAKSSTSELTVEAVRHTVNSWNPSYAKVMEFYGFYYPEGQGSSCTAYLLLTNPSDKDQKLTVYEAHFKRLLQADGDSRWYLTGLISHGSGLTRRQGWDTLLIPVKSPGS